MEEAQERGSGILARLRRRFGAGPEAEPSESLHVAPPAQVGLPESKHSVWLPDGLAAPETPDEELLPNGVKQTSPEPGPAPSLPPWMKIAQDPAPRSAPATPDAPEYTGGSSPTEARASDPAARSLPGGAPEAAGPASTQPQSLERQTHRWLPPALQQEENPLATGAWLPAEHSPPPSQPAGPNWAPTTPDTSGDTEVSSPTGQARASGPAARSLPGGAGEAPESSGSQPQGGARQTHQWLPPAPQQEENPIATETWLPAEDSTHAEQPEPPAPREPTKAPAPVPTSSWLPPEFVEPADETSAHEAAATHRHDAAPPPEHVPASEIARADSPGSRIAETPGHPPAPGASAASAERAPVSDSGTAPPDGEGGGYGRRTRAVEAYCRELLGAETATIAANDILNSLTRNIRDDAELLQMTRMGAAERVIARTRWGATAQVAPTCTNTPGLLAARANGTLSDQDHSELESHLAFCLICRAAEVRAARADRAFAGTIGLALSTKQN